MSETANRPLRIVHAVRAPVGGIIRHILDLANGQINAGHHVGIIADSLTGGDRAKTALAEIAPRLKLGVQRIAIHREPHPADVRVWAHFKSLIARLKPDVLHGHGAKAGTFIRLRARSKRAIRVYTPHGGSLHYPLDTWKGAIYGRIERTLYTLDWLEQAPLRRQATAELNKGESRNALARAVCFHRLGRLRDRTAELQQHRASGLTLVTAAIVLWNTVYLGRALDALRRRGEVVPDALLAHIAPLGWQHINLTGDYLWDADAEIGPEGFRALRGGDATIAQAA